MQRMNANRASQRARVVAAVPRDARLALAAPVALAASARAVAQRRRPKRRKTTPRRTRGREAGGEPSRRGRRRRARPPWPTPSARALGQPHARRRVGRDHRLAHARRHALRAERRRDDAAGVDDEDVHVGRRARSLRSRLHVPHAGAARRPVGPDGTLAGNLYLRGVGDPSLSSRFWHDARADGRAGQADRGRRHQARARRHRRRRDARSTTSSFPTAGRRATSARRTRRACRRCRSTRISSGSSVQPNGGKASVTLEPATTAIPVESTRAALVGGSGGRISASRRADGTITVRGSIGARFGPAQVFARRRQSGDVHDRRAARRAAESRASRSTDRRASARRRRPRSKSRRSRRRRSRRSSARWIARASTSSPSCSSARRRTRRLIRSARPRLASRTCATSCRRRSARRRRS